MWMNMLAIENFKGISDLRIQFKPGINILLGDNGVGKTSILEAASVALGGFLGGVNGVSSKSISISDVRVETVNIGTASTQERYCVPVSIECSLDADGRLFSWKRIREDQQSNRKTRIVKTIDDITKYASIITNSTESVLPVLSYQSSLRAATAKRQDFGASLKKNIEDRRKGYLGCLDAVIDSKRIIEWCYEMQMSAFEQGKKIAEYEQFKDLVGRFMQFMNEEEKIPLISYSVAHKDLVYRSDALTVPISYLSAGYQSVLWMIMDIAYRLCTLNPESDLSKSKGIVLIDEIDMHLHPKWQWKVVEALRTVFPEIQFIIATHSPIIISSCKDANLIHIDDMHQVTYLGDAYGYSVNDVLELCQGSMEILSDLKSKVNRFDAALDDENYSLAEKVLLQMKEEYGTDNTEVKKASAALETELFLPED